MNPLFILKDNSDPISKFLDVHVYQNLSCRNDLLVHDLSCDESIIKMCQSFGIPTQLIDDWTNSNIDKINNIVTLGQYILFKCRCNSLIKCESTLRNLVIKGLVYCKVDCPCIIPEAKFDLEKYYYSRYSTFNGTMLQQCKICRSCGTSACYITDSNWTHEINGNTISIPIINGSIFVKDLCELKTHISPVITL